MTPAKRQTIEIKSVSRAQQGTLFILVGPSGVGKNTLLNAMLKKKYLHLRPVITTTTRAPRPREAEGVSYFFVDDKKFDELIRRDELFEWVNIQTHRSGTPRHPTTDLLARGQNLIIHIDVKGADTFKRQRDIKTVCIFIAPASIDDLKKRLRKRKYLSEREREVRWKTAMQEMKRMNDFDFRVINKEGQLKDAIREVEDIIQAVK